MAEKAPDRQVENELRAAGDRIEILMAELAAASPAIQAKAEELVRLLMRLYGAGLERILSIVDEAGAAAGPVFARLAADDLVSTLLVLHDLHPLDLTFRVERALDHVRPYLESHGGNVTLLGIDDIDGIVVRLRLEGSCKGCPSSTITMKLAVEKAIEEAAPEVTRIEVEGIAVAGEPAAAPTLVQLGGCELGAEARNAASVESAESAKELAV
jgi:Fe-S cluster biogenesis protein NfuA